MPTNKSFKSLISSRALCSLHQFLVLFSWVVAAAGLCVTGILFVSFATNRAPQSDFLGFRVVFFLHGKKNVYTFIPIFMYRYYSRWGGIDIDMEIASCLFVSFSFFLWLFEYVTIFIFKRFVPFFPDSSCLGLAAHNQMQLWPLLSG